MHRWRAVGLADLADDAGVTDLHWISPHSLPEIVSCLQELWQTLRAGQGDSLPWQAVCSSIPRGGADSDLCPSP